MDQDWDDIRYFTAAAKGGSTLAASRVLGVSQTTVARRIDALEQRIAVRLFERHSGGYRLTAAGHALLDDADTVAWEVAEFLALFPAGRAPVSGVLRMVVDERLARPLVLPALDAIRLRLPRVQWELMTTSARADVVAAAADIGVHLAEPPAAPGVATRIVRGAAAWATRARQRSGLWISHPERRVPASVIDLVADALAAGLDEAPIASAA